MTNDEGRMTKEIRIPNDEARRRPLLPSCFVIPSSFVIRHSPSHSWGPDAGGADRPRLLARRLARQRDVLEGRHLLGGDGALAVGGADQLRAAEELDRVPR